MTDPTPTRPRTGTRDAVAEALEDARLAWQKWQDAWAEVQETMRDAGMSTVRIEAYRVGSGYDEGGGQSLIGWLDEIDREVEGDPQSCGCGLYPAGEHGCARDARKA